MPADLVKTLDTLATAVTLSTRINRVLPAPAPTPAIPARSGTGQPARA